MGWPALGGKKKQEDMQTYVGENINVGTNTNRLAPVLLTAAMTALGMGAAGLGTAWLLGAFDEAVKPPEAIERDYKITTSIDPPGG